MDNGDSVTRSTQGEVRGGKEVKRMEAGEEEMGKRWGGGGSVEGRVLGSRAAEGRGRWETGDGDTGRLGPPLVATTHLLCVCGLSSWPWGDRHGVAEPPHMDK